MSELGEWDNFYVILGSAAGALIGLQFVVMTLIAENPPPKAAEAGAAFATPTVVHFCVVLFLSAIIPVPWRAITSIAIIWGLVALVGVVYTSFVTRRMRVQTAYKPGLEDWLFHAVLPIAAYVILGVSVLTTRSHLHEALFGVGASTLLLLFIGIHNAWDAVVYHVFVTRKAQMANKR